MAISISYSYRINAKFVLNGKEEPILEDCINSVITNYDYDNNMIPIIYINANLETSLYNKMVLNENKGTITLTIQKAKNGSNYQIYTDYIKDTFIYMMNTNPDYSMTMNKQSGTQDTIATNYRRNVIIGLIQLSTTDNNRKIINNIIKDSNMASIIHKYTSHMKIVMEPLHVDKMFKYLIIPPFESVSKLLKYLNKQSVFYKGGYRYFVDFNKTYLLSMQGNPIDARDGTYNTIIINVNDPTSELSAQTGIKTDAQNKSYILNINADNTVTDIKKSEDKIFNKIMGIDSYGNKKELELNIPRTVNSSEKLRLERVPSDNLGYLDYLKDNIENSTIIFAVTKTEMDSSLITPNKEYIVRNYPIMSEYNGRYVLSYKKEVFLDTDQTMVMFGLRKIKDR